MKLKGMKKAPLNVEVVVLPRSEGTELVFKFRAVLNIDEYEKQYPKPNAPYLRRPGQQNATPDFDNPKYREQLTEWSKQQTLWLFLQSIKETEDLEWETVELNNPETWKNIEKELEDFGINSYEHAHLINAMLKVNALSDDHIREARERFFERQHQEKEKLAHS